MFHEMPRESSIDLTLDYACSEYWGRKWGKNVRSFR